MYRLFVCLFVLSGFFCFTASSFAQTATLSGTDTNTLGNWSSTYGTVGSYIPNGPSVTPSDGSTFNPGAAASYTWGTNVASTSALKTGSATDIASCWYNNLGTSLPSLSFDVVVPAGQSQTVALYLLDYDKQGRSESVQVTDASNNSLGPLIAVSGNNFANGEYLIWTISGEVHINITLVTGPNAVASGIFFGQNNSMPPPVTSGAYVNQATNQVSSSTTSVQVNKLVVPAGSYLIHFTVSIAFNKNGSANSEGLACSLAPSSSPYLTIDQAPPINSVAALSLSQTDHVTFTAPSTITASCFSLTGDELTVQSELEAVAVAAINVQ